MATEMWLTYNSNKKKLRFPVLPEKIDISYGSADDSTYVHGKGEVSLSKKPSAIQVKFDSFFPAKPCQGSVKKPAKPKKAVEFLKAVQKLDGCARFIYTGGAKPIAMNCRISFQITEQGGDVGTIYYSILIKEYKEVKYRRITLKTTSGTADNKKTATTKPQTEGRASTQETQRTYTVVSGDCLWNISKKFYGDGTKYQKIVDANANLFKGRSPNMIYAGDVLVIP